MALDVEHVFHDHGVHPSIGALSPSKEVEAGNTCFLFLISLEI